MRRLLDLDLGAKDRSPARHWAIALPSACSSILVIAMIVVALVTSAADKPIVVTSSESKNPLPDRSGVRPHGLSPYGSLPSMVAGWSMTKT
ncbi:hypothetical protein IC762_07815 [Bradyrhizobium genosp. L]|uniref:hypothetical protein n=1 Tax=Bradyrhizobium genosp. L TaxID=83637 RepID=UPI0018A2A783|nr:hypothetical protein [Bradyrhizobium genosp. L]QPF86194.1 hypothetical protein IC762_07815 [Bradyrhizobium genosp. L]